MAQACFIERKPLYFSCDGFSHDELVSTSSENLLEHFPTKWRPVGRKKMRQNKKMERLI
jgi:hypothetical protein